MDKKVAIIMGSQSDWETMSQACEMLDSVAVPYHVEVVSAHRTPHKMIEFAGAAKDQGYHVIIVLACLC